MPWGACGMSARATEGEPALLGFKQLFPAFRRRGLYGPARR